MRNIFGIFSATEFLVFWYLWYMVNFESKSCYESLSYFFVLRTLLCTSAEDLSFLLRYSCLEFSRSLRAVESTFLLFTPFSSAWHGRDQKNYFHLYSETCGTEVCKHLSMNLHNQFHHFFCILFWLRPARIS